MHVGKLDEVGQSFLQSLHPREIRRQSSSARRGTVKLLFFVTAPRGKPERQMKEMEHRSGTFFIFLGRNADRVEQQKEQHNTSSTSQTPSAPRHPEIFYMFHVGKLDEVVQWFSAAQQQQHSSSSTAAEVAATSSCCFWSQHPGSNQNAK